MGTHSSILAGRIPWTEEPGRLQSRGHRESDVTEHTCTHYEAWYERHGGQVPSP